MGTGRGRKTGGLLFFKTSLVEIFAFLDFACTDLIKDKKLVFLNALYSYRVFRVVDWVWTDISIEVGSR